MAKKIELLHTTYDESGNIESQEVVHPLTSPDCIIMENGKTLDEVMGDGIATPTLTHEGTSFKVGVGDSNIEVVDGDVAGMTLKGQSYQNILPKPTTLIMETDEKEFKINDKIDSNIIIDDNIAEIATVKGKTIVNTVQEESGSEYTVLGENLSGQSIVTINKPEGNIKGVTLQGQTLVNTIQEPCKDDYVVLGADDSIEISAETGGCATIENTVQGGINGATLKGQTLVNLIDTENGHGMRFQYDGTIGGDCYTVTAMSHGQKVVVKQAPSGWRYFGQEIKLQMLKPSTKYFVSGEFQGISAFQFREANSTKPISTHGDVINNRYAIIETAGDLYGNITSQCLYGHISSNIDSGSVLICNDVILVEYQEGMENWDIPYFEGMKSVQMPVLKATGKNLIDKYKLKDYHATHNYLWTEDYAIKPSPHIKLKPNTAYVLSFSEFYGDGQITLWNGKNKTRNVLINLEISKVVFTTTSEEDGISFYAKVAEDGDAGNYSCNIQLEESSIATSYEPYQSSTVTTEKNLFDGILTPDYLTDSTGQPSSLNGSLTHSCYAPSYIPIQANEKFRLRATSDGSSTVGDGRVYFYDKDYNYLNIYVTSLEVYTNTFSMDVIHTVPNNSNIAYMRVRFFNGLGVQADSVQINKVYELRAIGDVKDEFDLTTGKLTQRIGEVVLDGSEYENWKQDTISGADVNTLIFYTLDEGFNGFKPSPNVEARNSMTLCDKFQTKGDIYRIDEEGIMINNDARLYFRINKSKLTSENVDGFKAYLSSNSVTVQSHLATPTIKTVDLTVTDQDGNAIPHIQTQPNVTHITASSDYLIPTVTIDNNLSYDTIIKPSTLYTVRFKHDTVNTDNPLTVDLGGTVQTVTSTEFTITTPSELTHNQLVFSGKNNVVSEVQVIEGDVTNIEYPFFEGMNDVKFSDSKFIARNCPFMFGKGGRI